MYPKVGEYWYIVPKGYLKTTVLAKCVSVTNGVATFIGLEATYEMWEVVYGPLGFSYSLLYKWEPNWFWKLLGYK